jgi:HEAT repeat protein
VLAAIVSSRSVPAGPALEPLLTESLDDKRAGAADALGKLGLRNAAPKIRPLLNDVMFHVRLRAAAALYRLGDASGLGFLRQQEASEHATIRVEALEATSVNPDPAWQASVKQLLNDSDPLVRLTAARLIAPFDPAAARSTIDGLLTDSNLAIREASEAAAGEVATDFTALRRFLRESALLTRVRAAARILSLTR